MKNTVKNTKFFVLFEKVCGDIVLMEEISSFLFADFMRVDENGYMCRQRLSTKVGAPVTDFFKNRQIKKRSEIL